MKTETIKRIMESAEGDPAEAIHNEIQLENEIRKTTHLLNRQLSDEAMRHENAIAEIEQKRGTLQAMCPHRETTYHPDASGNNDSETVCNLCGKVTAKWK